jgi:hypothetical protein
MTRGQRNGVAVPLKSVSAGASNARDWESMCAKSKNHNPSDDGKKTLQCGKIMDRSVQFGGISCLSHVRHATEPPALTFP